MVHEGYIECGESINAKLGKSETKSKTYKQYIFLVVGCAVWLFEAWCLDRETRISHQVHSDRHTTDLALPAVPLLCSLLGIFSGH